MTPSVPPANPRFALLMGWRLFRRGRGDGFLSLVSWISLLGIFLGVASLIVVMSVMNGFESELRGRVLSVIPHGYIYGPGRRLDNWQEHRQQVLRHPSVLAAAPVIGGSAMLLSESSVRGIQLYGIDPDLEHSVSGIDRQIVQGQFLDDHQGIYGIVVGDILARQLQVGPGSALRVLLPRATVTPFGIFPRERQFIVRGTFSAGTQLDASVAFVHIGDAAKLYQSGETVTGLRIELQDLFAANAVLPALMAGFPEGSQAVSWSESQGSLFSAVRMEKTLVRMMLLFIILIAAFNIVSILTMAVSDKRSAVAVMRSMGATPLTIMLVFVCYGMLTGVLGVAGGVMAGVPLALYAGDVVAFMESLSGAKVFSPQVYFISYLPSVLHWPDVIQVAAISALLSLLATIYPSWRAAGISPAEALRYD